MHFSSVKFNEKIISEQTDAKFLNLSVFSFHIFHMVKIGQ